MNRILVILPMVLSVVLAGTITQAFERPVSQQRSVVSSSDTNLPGAEELQTAGNLPEGTVAAPSQLYPPTSDNYDPVSSAGTGSETNATNVTTLEPKSDWGSRIWSIMSPIGRFALSASSRVGTKLLNVILLMVCGVIFTSVLCSVLSPLCTISILGFGKAEVKEQVRELARTYMTPERVSAATSLVKRAIDKYTVKQKHPGKE